MRGVERKWLYDISFGMYLVIGMHGSSPTSNIPFWTYRNLLFFRCRNIFGRRSPSENLLREYFSYVNFFKRMRIHTCKTRAKEEDRRVSSRVTARARSTKVDVHPALLQAAAAIVRARIFINAHSSPPLSRFT